MRYHIHYSESTDGATIIRIQLMGQCLDGGGEEIVELVRNVLSRTIPSAVCIDVSDVNGLSRADTLGGLFPEILKKTEGVMRPTCIVATGDTAKAFRWALDASRVGELFDIPLHPNVEAAFKDLKGRLG